MVGGRNKTKMNKKYKLLNESLRAVGEGTIPLLILKGQAGTGKSYSTLKYMKDNNINYKYINNYATPLAFYKLVYNNRNRKVLIFDDVQSIGDLKIKSMLKSVCGELDDGKRKVSYHSTSPVLEKNGLPDSFELDVNIVLIFNNDISGFEPIINRGVTIDFFLNFDEMIERIKEVQHSANIEQEVLDYVLQTCNEATENLSIRTLVILSNLKRKGYDFKLFADEILKTDMELYDLITLSEKEWVNKTGYHRATYYRKKNKLRKKDNEESNNVSHVSHSKSKNKTPKNPNLKGDSSEKSQSRKSRSILSVHKNKK